MKIEIILQDNDYIEKIIFVNPEKIEQLKKNDDGIVGWLLRRNGEGIPIKGDKN